MSSTPTCWTKTEPQTFRQGLASGHVRWSSPLPHKGWCSAVLDEVARCRPTLWPVLQETLGSLNKMARFRGAFWTMAGHSSGHSASEQQQRLELLEALVLPEFSGPVGDSMKMGEMTLLHVGASVGWTEGVGLLLEAVPGWDLNARAEGQAALHLACAQGHVGMSRMLIARGASTEVLNHDGRTPFDCHRAMIAKRQQGQAGEVEVQDFVAARRREKHEMSEHERFVLMVSVGGEDTDKPGAGRRRL